MKFISSKLHVRRCPLIYISKGNRYLRQSGCSFSFSVACVREIVKAKSEKVKTKYRNVTRFSKLLRSAPQSSLKLVCEASLRNKKDSNLTMDDFRKQGATKRRFAKKRKGFCKKKRVVDEGIADVSILM